MHLGENVVSFSILRVLRACVRVCVCACVPSAIPPRSAAESLHLPVACSCWTTVNSIFRSRSQLSARAHPGNTAGLADDMKAPAAAERCLGALASCADHAAALAEREVKNTTLRAVARRLVFERIVSDSSDLSDRFEGSLTYLSLQPGHNPQSPPRPRRGAIPRTAAGPTMPEYPPARISLREIQRHMVDFGSLPS